jgi:hypothetical protein
MSAARATLHLWTRHIHMILAPLVLLTAHPCAAAIPSPCGPIVACEAHVSHSSPWPHNTSPFPHDPRLDLGPPTNRTCSVLQQGQLGCYAPRTDGDMEHSTSHVHAYGPVGQPCGDVVLVRRLCACAPNLYTNRSKGPPTYRYIQCPVRASRRRSASPPHGPILRLRIS